MNLLNTYGALWMTVTDFPATAIVPVRDGPAFPATRYVTVPLPVPGEPPVMAIQPTRETAVHAQSDRDALTLNPPLPP